MSLILAWVMSRRYKIKVRSASGVFWVQPSVTEYVRCFHAIYNLRQYLSVCKVGIIKTGGIDNTSCEVAELDGMSMTLEVHDV